MDPTSLEIVQNSSQTFTVRLNSEPVEAVALGVTSTTGLTNVSATPDELVFLAENWSSPQEIRVTADSEATSAETDGMTDGRVVLDVKTSTTLTSRTLDPTYTTPSPPWQVEVEIKSSTAKDVAVSPTSLTVTEGESESYSVVLTSRPSERDD